MPFVDSGYGLIYDRELNLTWLKDANYCKNCWPIPQWWDDVV